MLFDFDVVTGPAQPPQPPVKDTAPAETSPPRDAQEASKPS